MKKIILITIAICFATALSAQTPSGTYVACNDFAKNMYVEKIVFEANKVYIYYGTMGINIGVGEYGYKIDKADPTNELTTVAFEYNRVNDKLTFSKAIINVLLGKLGTQMGGNINSTELNPLLGDANEGAVYNKSGNCGSNIKDKSDVWIIVDDNSAKQSVATEIINNYLDTSDDNKLIPRLDTDKAIRSGKYTASEIAEATKLLHKLIDNELRKILIWVDAAERLFSVVGDNSAEFANAISDMQNLITFDIKGMLLDWFIKLVGLQSLDDFVGTEISNQVKQDIEFFRQLGENVKILIAQNDKINK